MAHKATQHNYINALEQYAKQYADIFLEATAMVFDGEMEESQLALLDEHDPIFGNRINELDKQLSKLGHIFNKSSDQIHKDIDPLISKYIPDQTISSIVNSPYEQQVK